jgi:hypothetical protein
MTLQCKKSNRTIGRKERERRKGGRMREKRKRKQQSARDEGSALLWKREGEERDRGREI